MKNMFNPVQNKNIVKVGGKNYPCRSTVGAMVRFNDLTGRDFSEIDKSSFTDISMYVYCCIVSACKADGVEFPFTFEEFADRMEIADFGNWDSLV